MSDDNREITAVEKPSFLKFLEGWLPFKLPRIPMPQTAKNLDKAMAKLVLLGGDEVASWLKRRSKVNDARAKATIELIRKGSDVVGEQIDAGHRELTERAIEAAIGESVQGQRNRERVAQFAANELELDPGSLDAPGDIDDDWLNAFSDRAARVSKEEMQLLWGRVLAGEIRKPGSFRLRTLQALSVIEVQEAKLIHRHMDLVVNDLALYVGAQPELARFGELLELESIGVLQGVGSVLNLDLFVAKDKPAFLRLAAHYAVRITSETPNTLRLMDICALTPFGKELFKLAQAEAPRIGLAEALARALMREGFFIDLVKLIPTADQQEFEVEVQKRLEPRSGDPKA